MKKNLYMILIIFLLIVAIIYFIANENLTTTEYINEEIAVDLSKCNIIIDENSHGGFLGDGERIVKADCSDNYNDILNQIINWNELPLFRNLKLIMYGGYKGDMYYGYELAEKKWNTKNRKWLLLIYR